MSDRFGHKIKENAGKTKYSSLNLNQTYKGTKVENKTSSGTYLSEYSLTYHLAQSICVTLCCYLSHFSLWVKQSCQFRDSLVCVAPLCWISGGFHKKICRQLYCNRRFFFCLDQAPLAMDCRVWERSPQLDEFLHLQTFLHWRAKTRVTIQQFL